MFVVWNISQSEVVYGGMKEENMFSLPSLRCSGGFGEDRNRGVNDLQIGANDYFTSIPT